jgi:probable nitrogen fixation protein
MMTTATAPLTEGDAAAMETPFIRALVRLIRAEDSYGAWEGKPDTALITPFILSKEERRALPMMADPDPDVLARVELFHTALSLAIEVKTGLIASPMMKMHHEGFGRVVLIAGKLVVLSRHLRDVHRFGFETIAKLAAEGEKFVAQAVEMINTYPEVARA